MTESLIAGVVRHVRKPAYWDQPEGAVIVPDADVKARLAPTSNFAVRPDDARKHQGQTRTNFVNSLTGAPMGKTEAGDTFEHLFVRRGKQLVEDQYGPIQLSTGTRTTPLDLVSMTHGGELKSLSVNAKNLKTAVKAAEVRRKLEAVATEKLKPLTLVQVIEQSPRGGGTVKLYGFEGFGSKAVSSMIYFGEYRYSKNDFRMAQKKSGHLDKALKRAQLWKQKQGLAASGEEQIMEEDVLEGFRICDPMIAGVLQVEIEPLVASEPREMYVATPEGARRFGVPIGTRIRSDRKPGGKGGAKASLRIGHRGLGPRETRKISQHDDPTKFVPTRPGQKAKIPAQILAQNQTGTRDVKRTPKHSNNALNHGERKAIGRTDAIDELIALSAKQRRLLEWMQAGKRVNENQKQVVLGVIRDAIAKLRKELGLGPEKKGTGEEKKNKDDKKEAKSDKKEPKGKKGKGDPKPKPGGKKGEENKFSKLGWLEGLEAALEALQGTSKGGGRQKGSKFHKASGAAKSQKGEAGGLKYASFTSMTDKELSEATVSLARRVSMAKKVGRGAWRIRSKLKKAKEERERRDRSDRRQAERDRLRERRRRLQEK